MNHPYKSFESTVLWSSIEKGIRDLIDNNDLELNTPIEYVVGYLCEALAKNNQ
ncbi:hypothetical protein [Paenibacillus wynnii]|uniref:hypothetical protein n=1 Tax=Paenibacillus wynnii TaxID=268407 RepID=UPI000AC20897|nr:hypothetical protein [Paenibacillus wynnii]